VVAVIRMAADVGMGRDAAVVGAIVTSRTTWRVLMQPNSLGLPTTMTISTVDVEWARIRKCTVAVGREQIDSYTVEKEK
jgi:hypothetical protein